MHPIASMLVTATALVALAGCAGNRPVPESPVESEVPAAQAVEAVEVEESATEVEAEVEESVTETDASAESQHEAAGGDEETQPGLE